jgi:hypothetical protein
MRVAGGTAHGLRTRALIVVLWRAGLRISEALPLAESDLDRARGGVLVRRGKGGKRRQVGMDRWAWEQLDPWLHARVALPVGALLCVINGPTRGRPWSPVAAGATLRGLAVQAGVRRRFRSASAPTRARGRNDPRRRAAQRDSTPARSREPGHHVGLPPGHRQPRDHQHRLRAPSADAPAERRPSLIVVVQLSSGRGSAGDADTAVFGRRAAVSTCGSRCSSKAGACRGSPRPPLMFRSGRWRTLDAAGSPMPSPIRPRPSLTLCCLWRLRARRRVPRRRARKPGACERCFGCASRLSWG